MSKKSKIIIICLAVAIVVAASVLIPVLLLKVNNYTKLQTPNKIEVVESENLIVLKTNKIENAVSYVFEITIPSVGKRIITNETNELVLDFSGTTSFLRNDFNHAGIYYAQVYAASKNAKDNSYKSNIVSFERYLQIKTPQIFKENYLIKWSPINFATKYEIVINSISSSYTKTIEAKNDLIGENETINFRDLISEFNLGSGKYQILIKALNDDKYYISSAYSNIVEFNI